MNKQLNVSQRHFCTKLMHHIGSVLLQQM
uniref:Uncharacterized protein n=1 Tax=Arundo donax TaxID=35708 RepID=A0A0A9GCR5_ARUDO